MASKLSTYDFSTMYTTLPHHLIEDKRIALIEHTFTREKKLYLACNKEHAFFTSDVSFYRRHSGLIEKYNVSPRKLLQQGISEPEFYGDLVYRIRKIVGKPNFSEQFRKLINRYKRIGYYPYIIQQSAYLVMNQIMVDDYALLFNCTAVVRASDSMTTSSLSFLSELGLDDFFFGLARRGSTSGFL